MKKMSSGACALSSGIVALALLGGCHATDPGPAAAIANPASEHCVKKGGTLEIVSRAGAGTTATITLP